MSDVAGSDSSRGSAAGEASRLVEAVGVGSAGAPATAVDLDVATGKRAGPRIVSPRAGGGGRQAVESLRWELEELGLGNYEARVMMALFQLGPASPGQIARTAEVPRTSTYQVLEELRVKELAQRLPSAGPAVWSAHRPDEVLDRLDAAHEERLRQQKARSSRVRDSLAELFPEVPETAALPYLQVLHDPSRVQACYEQMVSEAKSELLVYNRPPFAWKAEEGPSRRVLAAAKRVRARAIYEEWQVVDPAAEQWRANVEAYHAAGVEGRVVDKLPMKLVVVDRRLAILCVDDPILPNVGFPLSLLVEHPGIASAQADSFEYLWERARPYPGAGS